MFCRNNRFQGDIEELPEAQVSIHSKAVWSDVVYHSRAYQQAPLSCSYRVSFWHAVPGQWGEVNTVLHYAEVLYFVLWSYTDVLQQELLAWVQCFTHLQPNLLVNPELRYVTLVSAEPSKTCFIPAKSIQSRVIFITNPEFPMLRDVQATQTRNVRGMYVSKNLDHRWDQAWEEEEEPDS